MDRETKKRVIKTLLLCKHLPKRPADKSQQNPYEYNPKTAISAERYFTLGRFHALSIYETPDTQDNWLEGVLKDKQRIINGITDTISYHPIHLVRGTKGNETDRMRENGILLVTFVYGINDSKLGDSLKYITCKEGKYSFSAEENGTSIADVEVYHCINISDRVILTYTCAKNIYAALRAIHQLKTEGAADKTYTTVNFRMDGKTIHDDVLKTTNQKEDHAALRVCIRGTVRDAKVWADCYNREKDGSNEKNCIKACINEPCYLTNYGSTDFTIIGEVDEEQLGNLLSYYLRYSDDLTDACWDIYTELQLKFDPKGEESPITDKCVLNDFSTEFNKIYEKLPDDWDWKYALKELIQAQNNIDKNPRLQGPAYLLWDSFTVLYDYLAYTAGDDYSGHILDISVPDVKTMIKGSRDDIERYIRCLSQLTDQLTRNDDIVFHGFGSLPAISTAIPENLLEFYHAFLQKLSKALVEIDKKRYRILEQEYEEYKYGFLIAPELNKRARICQVFNAMLKYQDRTKAFRPWPSKQIYIIQMPIRDIFNPMHCMIPLAHECFHFFGDHLRCRRKRAYYATLFLAEMYVDGVLASSVPLGKEQKQLTAYAVSLILWDQHPIPKDESELYLYRLQEKLVNQYCLLITDEKTSELYDLLEKEGNGAFLYYNSSVSARWEMERNFLSEPSQNSAALTGSRIVEKCMYFFKECYADFMTITTLGLSIDEYLQAFEYEMKQALAADEDEIDRETKIVTICQRIAIVLAAYCQTNGSNVPFPKTEIEDPAKQIRVWEITKKCYASLMSPEVEPLQPKTKNDKEKGYYGVFPVASLRSVVDYLFEAYNDAYIENADALSEIRTLFDRYIRNEEMFDSGEAGEESIVEEARNNIRDKAEKWNKQHCNTQ